MIGDVRGICCMDRGNDKYNRKGIPQTQKMMEIRVPIRVTGVKMVLWAEDLVWPWECVMMLKFCVGDLIYRKQNILDLKDVH